MQSSETLLAPKSIRLCPARARAGTTITELLITGSLLLTMIGVVSPLVVRATRLSQDTRHYHLAIDEVSNQLELLTSLPASQRSETLKSLKVPDALLAVLPNAQVQALEIVDDAGARLEVRLTWDQRPKAKPLVMVGWLVQAGAEVATKENQP